MDPSREPKAVLTKNHSKAIVAMLLGIHATIDTARAQQPNITAGRAIAERACAGCHLIGGASQKGPVPAGVATFAEIASRPGQTAALIAGRIVIPHPPMPDAHLTRQEIADVAAYILSLGR
jgi:cytochrome c